MSQPAVRIHGLGKRYRLGEGGLRYDTLRDEIVRFLGGLRRREPSEPDQWIWALKDVTFEIGQGDVVAIIGRNGAGKSTLLKILSRITAPTEGRAELRGRVASLLDVGTGFHPELTGRENIYLNGAVLGMTRAEVQRKFDEIVAFAEIERFIDTPVKRYSSGMYVRLAFAVAAHVETEILIVDETLSVGDAAFQKKCLGKMDEAYRAGRTVVFVSHDLGTVTALATRAVLLEGGQLVDLGPARDVLRRYLQSLGAGARSERRLAADPDLPVAITAVATGDVSGERTAVLTRSDGVVVTVEGEVRVSLPEPDEYFVAIDLKVDRDRTLFRTYNVEHRPAASLPRQPGRFALRCLVPPDLLPAGTYGLDVLTGIVGKRHLQVVARALEFDVVQDRLIAGVWSGTEGLLTPRCHWTCVPPHVAAGNGTEATPGPGLRTVTAP